MSSPSDFLHRGQQTALIVIVITIVIALIIGCALGALIFGLNILDHFSFS